MFNGPFVLLEVILHVRGGEREHKGIKEVPYGGGRESVNEITKAVIIEEVKNDEAGSVGCGIGKVVVGAISRQVPKSEAGYI